VRGAKFLRRRGIAARICAIWSLSPASQAGYPGDYELTFFWSMFDGRQGYECCEGQELRFVARSEAASLHMQAYVTGIWDLAIAAMAQQQDFTAPTSD
jgi:hypothetical protein